MKAVLFAVLVALGVSACSQDGKYTMISHEDMTDTMSVDVLFTDHNDIIVNSGMMTYDGRGFNYYLDIKRQTYYRYREIENGFILMGTDNDDLFVFLRSHKD